MDMLPTFMFRRIKFRLARRHANAAHEEAIRRQDRRHAVVPAIPHENCGRGGKAGGVAVELMAA